MALDGGVAVVRAEVEVGFGLPGMAEMELFFQNEDEDEAFSYFLEVIPSSSRQNQSHFFATFQLAKFSSAKLDWHPK